MNSFRFHDPLWLTALLPVLLAFYWSLRVRRHHVVVFSSLSGLRDLPVTILQRVRKLLPTVRLVGLILIVGALARPQEGREEFRIRTEGIAIQLVIDRSGSMQALDFEEDGERVNRLAVVKRVINDFVEGVGELEGRADDRIGLVVFGGYAESRCPLTFDHGALLRILDRVEIPGTGLTDSERAMAERYIEGEAATAIGDALALGVQRLKGSKSKERIIILLSDGENTAGVLDPLKGAELAEAEKIKVYTIGIGSTGMAPFWVTDPFGRKRLRQDLVRLDEVTLRAIADRTGGQYFNARDTETLEKVYRQIDELVKTETEGVIYTDYRELFEYLLLPGLGLLLLELLLTATRFLTLP